MSFIYQGKIDDDTPSSSLSQVGRYLSLAKADIDALHRVLHFLF